jgi:hypothetical protein
MCSWEDNLTKNSVILSKMELILTKIFTNLAKNKIYSRGDKFDTPLYTKQKP